MIVVAIVLGVLAFYAVVVAGWYLLCDRQIRSAAAGHPSGWTGPTHDQPPARPASSDPPTFAPFVD